MSRLLLIFLCFLSFCGFSQKLSQGLSSVFKREITFGAGGGFAGEIKTYTLLENGEVYLNESLADSARVFVKNLTEKQTKDFFKKADALALDKMKPFNNPGNRYYFVNYKNPKKFYTVKITWGNTKYRVSTKVRAFYREVMTVILR
jgi:hypothetical protein